MTDEPRNGESRIVPSGAVLTLPFESNRHNPMKVRQTITFDVEIEFDVEWGRDERDEASLFARMNEARTDVTFPIHEYIERQNGVLNVTRRSDRPRVEYESTNE